MFILPISIYLQNFIYQTKFKLFFFLFSKKTGLTKQTRGIDNDDFAINSKSNSSVLTIETQSTESNDENLINNSMITNDLAAESDSVLLSINHPPTMSDLIESNAPLQIPPPADKMDTNDENNKPEEEAESSLTPYPSVNTPIVPLFQANTSPPNESLDYEAKAKAAAQEAIREAEATADAALIKLHLYNQSKTLPWRPKVRLRELESFLDQERKKFLGFGDLNDDLDTLIGLPYPIHESIRILKEHLYISLSDEQIKLEEKIIKYPMSTRLNNETNEIDHENVSPAEFLFSSVLNNLPQYLVNIFSF